MTNIIVRFIDWLTLRNVLHLPPALHWRVVEVANWLAEKDEER